MALTATSRTIENSARNLIMEFVFVDTAPAANTVVENAVTKVDATALVLNAHLKVRRIDYNVTNASVRIQWDATTKVDLAMLSGYGKIDLQDYKSTSGIQNDAGVGITGNILFTTTDAAAAATAGASGYTIILHMVKGT